MLGTSRRGRVFSPFSLPCPHGRSNCLGRKKGTGKRKRRRGKGEEGRETRWDILQGSQRGGRNLNYANRKKAACM